MLAQLRQFLLSKVEITGIVGDRVYPGQAPQDAGQPRLTYRQVSGPKGVTMGGPTDLSRPRVQIDIWAASYATARALSDTLSEVLHGFKGDWGSVRVQGSFVDNEIDLPPVAPTAGQSNGLHHLAVDLIVWSRDLST